MGSRAEAAGQKQAEVGVEIPGPYVCGECGSMIQKKQDDDGKMRGVYHGIGGRDGKNVWKDPRIVSICLLCGDRKQLKTNCVSRTLLKAPATQPPRPADALRDPTLEVARVKCVYQDCASHLKPAPNLVVLDRASDDSLKRRYTCLACKRQWE